MNVVEQGTQGAGHARYQAIPRTLVFLTAISPETGAREVLLLKGAAHKRLWANQYNGLGGHVEAGEDLLEAAVREVREETGVEVEHLELRGVVNIDTGEDGHGVRPGVVMFVFVGETGQRLLMSSDEGVPEWVSLDSVLDLPLVDDLYEVLPRALSEPFFYGHYSPEADGTLRRRFR